MRLYRNMHGNSKEQEHATPDSVIHHHRRILLKRQSVTVGHAEEHRGTIKAAWTQAEFTHPRGTEAELVATVLVLSVSFQL